MQAQKDDAAGQKTDVFFENSGFAHRNVAKLGQKAMRFLQRGHDLPPIASHLQHAYLPTIEGE